MSEHHPDQLRPRRTHASNEVKRLPGGNEDNDLWVCNTGQHLISTWVPTDEQRARIAAGENIDLAILGQRQPPVILALSSTPIGKRPPRAPV